MEQNSIKSFIKRKLRPSQAAFHKASPNASSSSYSVKPFGLQLKAFFLCLFASKWKSRKTTASLRPLSESGGAQLPLLFILVATFLSLPLFFNLGNAVADSKSAVPIEATSYSNSKEVLKTLRDDNIKLNHRPERNVSLTSLPGITERTVSPIYRPTPPDFKRGSLVRKEVSFTFDGGSHRGQTAQILHILRQRRVKTTLFLTGQFIQNNPALVRRMLSDGHEIGNHLMDHPHLTTYSKNKRHRRLPHVDRAFLLRQLHQTARIYTKVTGEKLAPIWRAPYGEVNKELRSWAYNAGYMHIGWTTDYKRKESLDSLDWVSDPASRLYRTSTQMKDRILSFGKDSHGLKGGVALMHLGTYRRTEKLASRLGEMIDTLHTRGYRFVKVSTLIKARKKTAAYLPTTDHLRVAQTD